MNQYTDNFLQVLQKDRYTDSASLELKKIADRLSSQINDLKAEAKSM